MSVKHLKPIESMSPDALIAALESAKIAPISEFMSPEGYTVRIWGICEDHACKFQSPSMRTFFYTRHSDAKRVYEDIKARGRPFFVFES